MLVILLLLLLAAPVQAEWVEAPLIRNAKLPGNPYMPDLPDDLKPWKAIIPTDPKDGTPMFADATVWIPDRVVVDPSKLAKDSKVITEKEAVSKIQSRDSKVDVQAVKADTTSRGSRLWNWLEYALSWFEPAIAYAGNFIDNFIRADGSDIGVTWATMSGATNLVIASNKLQASSTATESNEYFGVAGSFGTDQFAEVTLTTWNTGGGDLYAYPMVRVATGAATGYYCVGSKAGGDSTYLQKIVAGTPTVFANANVEVWAATDKLRCEVRGTTITEYRNGVSVISSSDGDIASGNAGVGIYVSASAGDVEIGQWAAGDWQMVRRGLGF